MTPNPDADDDQPRCHRHGCRHITAAHALTPDGARRGECAMFGCGCPGLLQPATTGGNR